MSNILSPHTLRPIGLDSETYKIQPGCLTPPLVCVSSAIRDAAGGFQTNLMLKQGGLAFYRLALSDPSLLLIVHNLPFDFGVACSEDPSLIFLVFDALNAGRMCCTIVVQKLIDIALGHRKFRRINGRVTKTNYGLDALIELYYGEVVQKTDTWRTSYALLDGVPLDKWPVNAKKYAIYDSVLHLRLWESQQRLIAQTFGGNLPNQLEQQRANWVLHLMSMWGIRADAERVDYFIAHCNEEIGKMHQALLYCLHCGQPKKTHDNVACAKFENTGIFKDDGSRTMAEIRRRVTESFTRMKLPVPMTDPSPKFPQGQVSMDKDTLDQTDDPHLHVLAESMTFAKHLGQWGPVLRAAIYRPVVSRYEILVETGRTSCGGSEGQEGSNWQNPPRKGDVRPAVIPRPGNVFCATDADTIELRAHAQNCKEMVGWSHMADRLIEQARSKGPDLHEVLGAAIMGMDAIEFQKRRKEGDVDTNDARQFAKCFHPDTEILTRTRGWQRIADLTMEDEVASVVPHENRPQPVDRQRDAIGRFPPATDGKTRQWWQDTKNKIEIPSMEIVWAKPTQLTKRLATDGLLHFKNGSIDLRVTPDHRMLTYGATKLTKVVEARAFGKQRGWFNAGMWNGGSRVVDERLLRLAVATQADGNYIVNGVTQAKIRFGFSKQRKIDRLTALLEDGEYRLTIHNNGRNKQTTAFVLNEDLSDAVKELLDTDKTLPWWWMEFTPALRKVVIDEVEFWDAHRSSGMRCYHFSTMIKKNAEVLQAMACITNRKATYVAPTPTKGGPCYDLSVKQKYDTRGEKVEVTQLDYDGEVVCLSVPSEHVLVRDNGIPVITLQCPNFGFPGGLGPETFVAYSAGMLSREQYNKWFGADRAQAVLKAKMLREVWFDTFPENRYYFEIVGKMIDRKKGYGTVRQLMSGRIRGECRFTAASNGFFQGRVSDGFKAILWRLGMECYTGRETNVDGQIIDRASILFGSRLALFLHDEPILEHPEATAHERAERQRTIVVETLSKWLPDIPCTSSAVLSRRWHKGAEPLFVNGRLVPVKPEKIVSADGTTKIKWVEDKLDEQRIAA